jgi:hypothetical protein
MTSKSSDDQYSEQHTDARREAAVKRMLSTPHKPYKPHKPIGKKKKSPRKATIKASR